MAFLWLAIHDVTAILAGVYLVTHDYPWWGALCFVMAFLATVSTTRTESTTTKGEA